MIESLRINPDRLTRRLDELGKIGEVIGPNGERGCARLALTDDDRAGRDLVVAWMHDLDLEVAIDAIGNIVGRRAGADPTLAPVMTGSHIDTVRTGGRFDGNLGVLAGLEVVETLSEHAVTTERDLCVAVFTDEEGARFPPDMLGSLVYVGGMALETALDVVAVDDGARLGDELLRIGYAGPVPVPVARPPHRFVELHIEQGPILEDANVTIGAVESVQGISWIEYTLTGRSAHAGTTPMALRRDPMVVAGRIIAETRAIAEELGGDQVATVGRVDVHPNLTNVIPSAVTLTVDLRHTDDEVLHQAETRLGAFVERVARAEGVGVGSRSLARFDSVRFDDEMTSLVGETAERLGYSWRRLPSGAGHDAQMLARVCPTSMIFTPSVGGLSHNLGEFTHDEDVAAGANVLLHVMLAHAGGVDATVAGDPAAT